MKTKKFLTLAFEPWHCREITLVLQEADPRVLNKEVLKLRLDQVAEIAEIANMDLTELVVLMLERRCRVCGCTQEDCSQCIARTGSPCSWVQKDLCSACV